MQNTRQSINVLFGIYASSSTEAAQDTEYVKRFSGIGGTRPQALQLARSVLSCTDAASLNRYIGLVCGFAAFGDKAAEVTSLDPLNTYENPLEIRWTIPLAASSDPSRIYDALAMYGDSDIVECLAHTGWVEAVQAASLQLLRWASDEGVVA